MNRRGFLHAATGTVVAGVGMGLAGCTAESEPVSEQSNSGSSNASGGEQSTPQSTSTATAQPTESQYEYSENGIGITDMGWVEGEYGNVSLAGTATNLTDSTLSYVQISVSFLDASGAQIGTGLANTNNLAAGQRWKWEAMFTEMDTSDLDSANITAIDAY
jgi:hypothetical protein